MEKSDITKYKHIWVFVEHEFGKINRVSFELLSKARELAKDLNCEVHAFTVGDKVKQFKDDVFKYGATKYFVIEDPFLKEYVTEPYRDAIVYLINKYKPEVVLVGATTLGRDLAGTIATELKTGLTADTTGLDIDPKTGNLLMTRPTFGGNLMATIFCPDNRPQMSTSRPGVYKAVEAPVKGEVVEDKYEFQKDKYVKKIVDRVLEEGESINLGFYDIIVSGGFGMGSAENFKYVQELADVLGGTWAASRKAVQAGWVPQSRQVGQTGQTVHPKIYIACGISGAIQHQAGMKSSETIIAINKDPDAPIFEIATYGITGDVLEVLPKMTKMFKERLGKA